MIKWDTKQNINHRRDEFASRRRALLYCIRFCHSLLIMPKLSSLNPDRSAIPQKSATFSNCKSAAHFRPPSMQLKPISIFLKGEFEAAHSRKVDFATAYSRLTTCIAPSSIPDRSTIPQKSATLSKVGICRGSQPQGRNLRRLTAVRRSTNKK